MKIHTTNYYDTLIEVSEDTKATKGMKPPGRLNPSIAELQYDLISNHPYAFTSDDILFKVYSSRNNIPPEEQAGARNQLFSRGQPCMRTSPLAKTYGFGIHHDSEGRVAILGMESLKYNELRTDPLIKKVKAMRTHR